METRKAPLSIRIIYWSTNLVLGLLSLVFVAFIAFNILLYTDIIGNDIQLHIQLPGKLDLNETGVLNLTDQEVQVELVEISGKLHFINTPTTITKKIAPVIMVVILIIGYLTYTFRTFIKNVKNGNVFTLTNIALLKRIAYGLVGYWLFYIIYMSLMFRWITQNLEFESIRISSEFSTESWALVIALLLWVLAHIFKTGLELKEETELTI